MSMSKTKAAIDALSPLLREGPLTMEQATNTASLSDMVSYVARDILAMSGEPAADEAGALLYQAVTVYVRTCIDFNQASNALDIRRA